MLPHLSRDGDKFIIYNNQIQFHHFFFFLFYFNGGFFFGGGGRHVGWGDASRQGLQSVEYVLYIVHIHIHMYMYPYLQYISAQGEGFLNVWITLFHHYYYYYWTRILHMKQLIYALIRLDCRRHLAGLPCHLITS